MDTGIKKYDLQNNEVRVYDHWGRLVIRRPMGSEEAGRF